MKKSSILLVVAALAAFWSIQLPARGANPSQGTVSKSQDATWSGGPFAASNPATCAGSVDPTCDHFALTVNAHNGAHVMVAIASNVAGDDYDLFVFYPDGSMAAQKATSSGNEMVVFEHSTDHGSGAYEVRVQPFLVTPGSTYQGLAQTTHDEIDTEHECLEPVPDSGGIPGLTDHGQIISLDAEILLDGVSRQRGENVMAKATESYAPLSISLHAKFRSVSFVGDEAEGLIQQAKDLFRGERPQGIDVVYVLTAKNIQSGGNTGVAGLADCIGGVRYPNQAFAVGENITDENRMIGPFVTLVDATAKVAAHEIGHLMGAHHHYANCVEGLSVAEAGNFELSPCTLMFNFVNFASLNFSTFNGVVVRGHAVNYAAP
jgi:hypothetical protein